MTGGNITILIRMRISNFNIVLCINLSRGKVDEVLKIEQQLSELEERANHLDKMRTSTISSISYINDRNRKRNVEEAEKAILVHFSKIQIIYVINIR
jgi:hypothetical protein